MAETLGFTCEECGEWHAELPDVAFGEPDPVSQLDEAERQERVESLGDFRIVRWEDQTDFFIRGVLEIPIVDYPAQTFAFGAWTTLSEASFLAARELYRTDSAGGPFFGWFANRIPGIPDTYLLETNVHLREGIRASIALRHSDHLLSRAQHHGITLAALLEMIHPFLRRG